MLKIKIIAIGKRMPTWVTTAFTDYQKRFPKTYQVELIEIAAEKRGKNDNVEKLTAKEGQLILNHIDPSDTVIALDERGKPWSTRELASKLNTWYDQSLTLCWLIGGPDGLAQQCQQRAQHQFSLSNLILPHPMVRIILIEQLYRAMSINTNHPYHRD